MLMTCVGVSSQSQLFNTILVKGGLSSLPMQVISTPLARSPLAMEEIWLYVEGTCNLYQVSNLGNVRSLDRVSVTKHGVHTPRKGKLLRQANDKNGYKLIGVQVNSIKKIAKVHRLVAQAFVSNPDNLPCVNHINGIKHDNRAENLEWVSYSQNTVHSYEVLKRKSAGFGKLGKLHKQSHVIEQVCMTTHKVIHTFHGTGEIVRMYGFDNSSIHKCCKGRHRSYKGFIWRYAAHENYPYSRAKTATA